MNNIVWIIIIPLILLSGCFGSSQNGQPATSGDIQQLNTTINVQLTSIGNQIQSINQSLDVITIKLDSIETEFSSIQNKLNMVTNNIVVYSIAISLIFSFGFNLAWKLLENNIKIEMGGIGVGILLCLLIFALLISINFISINMKS
jgi:hypothetical protein